MWCHADIFHQTVAYVSERFLTGCFSEHVKTKQITVKLLKHTFRNTTYSKAIKFRFTMQYQ